MAGFDTYKDLFPHARLTRSQDGVLEVVLHTGGATLVFNGYTHEEFVELFHQIGQDARNQVVIRRAKLVARDVYPARGISSCMLLGHTSASGVRVFSMTTVRQTTS
jgi:hypothetical protein